MATYMKTKLLFLLFILLPAYIFCQNYEKEGDDLFAQAQYEQAEKKYKAAIVVLGETASLKQKQLNCSKCGSLLANAKTAENESRYSDAAKHYSDLYAIHSLAKYQAKANTMKQKVQHSMQTNNEVYDLVVGAYSGDVEEPLREIRAKGFSNAFVVSVVDNNGRPMRRVVAKRTYSKEDALRVKNALKSNHIDSWIWHH